MRVKLNELARIVYEKLSLALCLRWEIRRGVSIHLLPPACCEPARPICFLAGQWTTNILIYSLKQYRYLYSARPGSTTTDKSSAKSG